jgi:hypothetical protein
MNPLLLLVIPLLFLSGPFVNAGRARDLSVFNFSTYTRFTTGVCDNLLRFAFYCLSPIGSYIRAIHS